MKDWKILSGIAFVIMLITDITNKPFTFGEELEPAPNWLTSQPFFIQVILILGAIVFGLAVLKPKAEHFQLGLTVGFSMYVIGAIYGVFFDKLIDGDQFVWNLLFGSGIWAVIAVIVIVTLLVATDEAEDAE